MDNQRYFPPLYGGVECGECDMAAVCHSCGKYQRDRRDFTYTSGRCPGPPPACLTEGALSTKARRSYMRRPFPWSMRREAMNR